MVIAVYKNITHYLFEIFLLENQVNHGNSENKISDCNKNKNKSDRKFRLNKFQPILDG